MPFLNSRGQSLHGIGGLQASIDNQNISGEWQGSRTVGGGVLGWKTDDIAVFATRLEPIPSEWPESKGLAVVEYHVPTGRIVAACPRGSNAGKAGGGIWVAQFGDLMFDSLGREVRGQYVATVSPHGDIAYTPHSGFPLNVRTPDGGELPLGVPNFFPIASLQLLSADRAIGHLDVHFSLVTIGMPAPVTVGRVRHIKYLEVNGEGWELCWAEDQGRILLHPATSTMGYVVRDIVFEGGAFNSTAIVQGSNILVAWGSHEGEQAGESVTRLMDLSAPRIDLASRGDKPEDKPEDPDKPEEPKPVDFPNILETIKRVRAKYPNKIDWNQAVAIINESCWIHKGEGWMLLRKDGGNHGAQPTTGIPCSVDWICHKPTALGLDALGSTPNSEEHELGVATPQWGEGQPVELSRLVPPVAPGAADTDTDPGDENDAKTHPYTREDNDRDECNYILPNGKQCDQPRAAAIHQGKIDPPIDPLKPQPSGSVDAAVQKLIAAAVAPLSAELGAVKKRLADVESRPGGPQGSSFPSRISLLTAHGTRLVAPPEGGVGTNDHPAGAWETFTIEKQE